MKKTVSWDNPQQQDIPGRIGPQMTHDGQLAEMTEIFKCFSDLTRLKIINALLLSELRVHSLTEILQMSQPAVSHHLKQLRQMRLIKCRREGKTVYYSLDDYHVQLLFDICKTHVKEQNQE
ncbi:MAG: winged helix-turn-helix transcriptional regulator [Thermoguttaceae bacterium]|nr:winged helix-turn-helix transcriptional regulator [Thermoguttaceae bacterium]